MPDRRYPLLADRSGLIRRTVAHALVRRLLAAGLVLAVAAGGLALVARAQSDRPVVRVAVVHSRSGPLAASEEPVLQATLAAIADLNRRGGILGARVIPVIADGRSDPETFARETERLIREHDVAAVFGCWSSASRKAVLPVLERHGRLLFYPVQYEGLEQSPNVFYLGPTANQQVLPATHWAIRNLGRRLFLVGSDYVFPRIANELIREHARSLGADVVGEEYLPLSRADARRVVERIGRARPDVVLNSVNGDGNAALFKALAAGGAAARRLPVLSFSIDENELRGLPAAGGGHYAPWPYFETNAGRENRRLKERLAARSATAGPVSDPMVAAWDAVTLWADAARRARGFDTHAVREAARHWSGRSARGIVTIDPETQHAWLAFRVGRARADGQFDTVSMSQATLRPLPFPATRPRVAWERFLRRLYLRWGRRWEAPR